MDARQQRRAARRWTRRTPGPGRCGRGGGQPALPRGQRAGGRRRTRQPRRKPAADRRPAAAAAASRSNRRQRRFPFDPNGPPVATFFEAGGNIEGGLPYTPWAAEIRKQRLALNARDNPDAMCMPMGFLQFHQQPQPRRIIQTDQDDPDRVRGQLRPAPHLPRRPPLPKQGEPQPWWYGYSVGRWDGDTLVVETNNLRGAEDGPYDGWLDVNGSPYSNGAKFTERFRRRRFGQLQIDLTIEDPKAYTKPWTVRVDQRFLADEEMIEFVCNENQQFRERSRSTDRPAPGRPGSGASHPYREAPRW